MNIHEYQAKQIFKAFGVPVLDGYPAKTPLDCLAISKKLNSEKFVVKAQIHAGGRGKAGGVKIANSHEEVYSIASEMLGMILHTHQTGLEGKEVKVVYIEEAANIKKEYYLGIILNRNDGVPVMMASAEGGVDIEIVAKNSPEKILREIIDPLFGLQDFQIRNFAYGLGLKMEQVKSFSKFALALYNVYARKDASMIEINPLALLDDDRMIALDAKMSFDDNSLFRHPDVVALRDLHEEDPAEVEAAKYELSYVKLNGNVGCMVNGAGLAMSTMDIIKHKGGEPANFLDVGGNASPHTVAKGFSIILSDKNVKAIFVNIFGGIVRCDRIAKGIIEAAKSMDVHVPVVVRLDGTNAKEAKEILEKSHLENIISVSDLNSGAEMVVDILKNQSL